MNALIFYLKESHEQILYLHMHRENVRFLGCSNNLSLFKNRRYKYCTYTRPTELVADGMAKIFAQIHVQATMRYDFVSENTRLYEL